MNDWFKSMSPEKLEELFEAEEEALQATGGLLAGDPDLFSRPFVGVSEFVKRQSQDSQYTDYRGSWSDLVNRTIEQIKVANCCKGYRDGVIIVHMPESECPLFSTYEDFPIFEGMKLEAVCKRVAGREHEPPKIQVLIREPKKPCKYVDIILYRFDVLEEDGDRSTDAFYEIVSINGRLNKEPKPMDPLTIVRNWLHLPGGTEMKGKTAEEVLDMLCESILYKNGIKK